MWLVWLRNVRFIVISSQSLQFQTLEIRSLFVKNAFTQVHRGLYHHGLILAWLADPLLDRFPVHGR